jgi:hypothetical protein
MAMMTVQLVLRTLLLRSSKTSCLRFAGCTKNTQCGKLSSIEFFIFLCFSGTICRESIRFYSEQLVRCLKERILCNLIVPNRPQPRPLQPQPHTLVSGNILSWVYFSSFQQIFFLQLHRFIAIAVQQEIQRVRVMSLDYHPRKMFTCYL